MTENIKTGCLVSSLSKRMSYLIYLHDFPEEEWEWQQDYISALMELDEDE